MLKDKRCGIKIVTRENGRRYISSYHQAITEKFLEIYINLDKFTCNKFEVFILIIIFFLITIASGFVKYFCIFHYDYKTIFTIFFHLSTLPKLRSGPLMCHLYLFTKFSNSKNISVFLQQKYIKFSKFQNMESKQNINYALSSIFSFINKLKCPSLPQKVQEGIDLWKKEINDKYSYTGFPLITEVFYFEHGLRFASPKIQKYVQDGDIMDIGAYIGDSAFIFYNRTKKRIFSYEFNLNDLLIYQKNIKRFNFDPNKLFLIKKGISDKIQTIYINNCEGAGCNLFSNGTIPIQITTIDSEVEENNITLHYFKADVEGVGLQVLKGGYKSILKYRPVFDIAIYHNIEELLEIPEFILNLPNYAYEFHHGNDFRHSFAELSIFAYPFELIY